MDPHCPAKKKELFCIDSLYMSWGVAPGRKGVPGQSTDHAKIDVNRNLNPSFPKPQLLSKYLHL
jgi:hypothetical protein